MIRATNGAILGYANFHSTVTQTAAAIDTPYTINLETTPMGDGSVRLVDNNKIYFDNAGPYNLSFSLQVVSTNSSSQTIDVWVKHNGGNEPWTDTKVNVLKGPNVAAWNIFGVASAGDYIQVMWSTSSTDVSLYAYPATDIHPGSPSAIVTINRLNQV